MRLERLNLLSLNTVAPNFVTMFVFFGTASRFIERICFSKIEARREAILFLFGCMEVNSPWIITSGIANQRAPKALFTCVVYTNTGRNNVFPYFVNPSETRIYINSLCFRDAETWSFIFS